VRPFPRNKHELRINFQFAVDISRPRRAAVVFLFPVNSCRRTLNIQPNGRCSAC